MKTLTVGSTYNREEVHSIFSPDTVFTPQAGTWGLHGIVKVPDRDGDYVFFVSLGQQQGDHVFDEGISEGGVLSWQSQPRQGLDNKDIVKLIKHDEATNNLHLFLRNSNKFINFTNQLTAYVQKTSKMKEKLCTIYYQKNLKILFLRGD